MQMAFVENKDMSITATMNCGGYNFLKSPANWTISSDGQVQLPDRKNLDSSFQKLLIDFAGAPSRTGYT